MFRIRILLLIMVLCISVSANAATKAIKFGKLWDGHKAINNAVVVCRKRQDRQRYSQWPRPSGR